jgi:TadE-like protein
MMQIEIYCCLPVPGSIGKAGWPRRLARDERGATMVEFSLIALPFMILLFGAFEIGFIYWAGWCVPGRCRRAGFPGRISGP